jgi:ribA/ribD-fused uncharacterized protein
MKIEENNNPLIAFSGEKRFLSNMWIAPFFIPENIVEKYKELELDSSLTFISSEHFYQYHKSYNKEYRKLILEQENPHKTKSLARKLIGTKYELSYNWEEIKDTIMEIALECKFSQNIELLEKLSMIKGIIEEINNWNDTYWGICNGIGQNKLGKMLMNIRNNYNIKYKNKLFFPVIHVTNNIDNFWKNIDICLNTQVDGIFLISHGYLNPTQLHNLGKEVKEKNPFLWIGYNFLEHNKPKELFSFLDTIETIDGIWIDDSKCGIDNETTEELLLKKELYKRNHKDIKNKDIFCFGGVAFKYCKQPDSLTKATQIGTITLDVVTTSGEGTGIAADIQKIKTMHQELNEYSKTFNIPKKLAIASGISYSNIEEYLPYIDIFLVSSSISLTDDLFDESKVLQLSKKIHNFL